MEVLQIIQNVSDFSGIPAKIEWADGTFQYIPGLPYQARITETVPGDVYSGERSAAAVLTDELLCCGRVRLDDGQGAVLFGPVITLDCNNARAQRILRKCGLPTTESGQLISYLRTVPMYSYWRFCRFICYAHFALTARDIALEELLEDAPPGQKLAAGSPPQQTSVPAANSPHNAQAYENAMFSMIRFGQYDKIEAFLQRPPYSLNQGTLAPDLLRHQKNLLIASITLSARCAVNGGVDYETAMSLADAYIQKVELAPNVGAMKVLQDNIVRTYTRMVWEKKHNNSEGNISSMAHRYIDEHVGEHLSGEIVAGALGVSRSYLSSQFKKETGIGLNEFINQVKVDEAKRLLLTTDLTAAEVALQTSFSSPAYFSTIFKRITGDTPNEFRQKRTAVP